jgi:hypothetical protein
MSEVNKFRIGAPNWLKVNGRDFSGSASGELIADHFEYPEKSRSFRLGRIIFAFEPREIFI